MPLKKSYYDYAEHQRDVILHKGYSYEGNIFKQSMSKYMFTEEKRVGILVMMEKVVFELIERVKLIKIHFSYAHKKNTRTFN